MDRWSTFCGHHFSTNLCKCGYGCSSDLCLIRSANLWKTPKYMFWFFNICATLPVSKYPNIVSIYFFKYLDIHICICCYSFFKKIRMKVTLGISKTPRTRTYTFDKEATKYQPVINKDELIIRRHTSNSCSWKYLKSWHMIFFFSSGAEIMRFDKDRKQIKGMWFGFNDHMLICF